MIVTTSARRTSKRANPAPVVLIRSSAYASLPSPGNRVGTSDVANMPTIRSSSATGTPAILTADGAHHYRLLGLNIESHTGGSNGAVVQIGGAETTLSEFPTDITIDRCVVKGDTESSTIRGVQLDGIRCAVVDSYICDFKSSSDTQAVYAYNTPGPLKVVNNYLEATGENIMFGGSDPSYADSIPSDIEIRRNYFKKQSYATWVTGGGWTNVKNLLEFKNAQRVLVEGNVLDTCYASGQSGFGILITPRNQSGTAPWCTTQDITLRHNKMTNVGCGINILGNDAPNTSGSSTRIAISNNFIEIVIQNGEAGRTHQFITRCYNVEYKNNTFVIPAVSAGAAGVFGSGGYTPVRKSEGTVYENNIFSMGLYGFFGDGTAEGDASFTAYHVSPSFTYNFVIGSSATYPGSNNQFPALHSDVFTDFAGGDYTVKAPYAGDGPSGVDPGCNWTTLNAATANAIDGLWGSEHTTYSDHSYTNAELPRTYIDTTYANQSGTEWIVTSAAEFTTALAGCAVGDIITLTAGNTFTGSFTLRAI